jgi:hypothetical protein
MEDFLDGDDVRPVRGESARQRCVQRGEPRLDRSFFSDREHPVVDVAHARPIAVLDDAEPAVP